MVALLILGISLGFGFAFDGVCTVLEKKDHPRPDSYAEYVTRYSNEYGVPEYIIYALIKSESDFESDRVSDDGRIGLMQLSPKTLEWLSRDMLGESLNSEMLFSPETNIKYGTYYLSYLYHEYGIWNTCYVAYHFGIKTVGLWSEDSNNVDENGILSVIPEPKAEEYLESVLKAVDMYTRLYYNEGK
jgi:soluble lytic murein transglycosylase